MIRVMSLVIALLASGAAFAQTTLMVNVQGIQGDGKLAAEQAMCVGDASARTRAGQNVSPAISWSPGPQGTQSYVLIMHDTDVPSVRTDANRAGVTLPASAQRQNLYHWVLADIPAATLSLARAQGTHTAQPPVQVGLAGINDMNNRGYDGPCPPWNDEALHRYHFTVYALNVASLGLPGNFTAADVMSRMQGRVLGQGEAVGTFTQNPALTR